MSARGIRKSVYQIEIEHTFPYPPGFLLRSARRSFDAHNNSKFLDRLLQIFRMVHARIEDNLEKCMKESLR